MTSSKYVIYYVVCMFISNSHWHLRIQVCLKSALPIVRCRNNFIRLDKLFKADRLIKLHMHASPERENTALFWKWEQERRPMNGGAVMTKRHGCGFNREHIETLESILACRLVSICMILYLFEVALAYVCIQREFLGQSIHTMQHALCAWCGSIHER